MNAKTKTIKKPHVTEAVHAKDGDQHIFGVKALRVLLIKDEASWFAQGLEIDYAACGNSVEQVKKNFEDGLEKTVHEHLVMHGAIDKLLKIAPQEAWDEYFKAQTDCVKARYTAIQFHTVNANALPFTEVQFIERLAA
jgi:hypothetical protein